MPQHPCYDANVEDNITNLYDLINKLIKYGIMHEDCLVSVEDAFKKIYRSEEDEDDFDYEDYSLADYVDKLHLKGDKACQFVQDLRNAIALSLQGDYSELSEEILNHRDLGYYKECVMK
jgi:hypothetical protein